jgi:hypothetical protein
VADIYKHRFSSNAGILSNSKLYASQARRHLKEDLENIGLENIQALFPHLRKGSVVLKVGSDLASVVFSAEKTQLDATAYEISKVGLDMLTVHQARHLREWSLACVCASWVVQTDMGGDKELLTPEESR